MYFLNYLFYFMEFMFHAFTLLLALDHIEASVSIPLGVHPSFFQHHRLVLVEKKHEYTILYILSFTSHSPTYRTHTKSDMREKKTQTLIYCTAFSHDEKELNDDAADSGSTYILCRWTIKTAVATATRWQRWSKHIKKKTVLMGFVPFFFFSRSSINLQSSHLSSSSSSSFSIIPKEKEKNEFKIQHTIQQ